jgi:anti-sigma factor RsiW
VTVPEPHPTQELWLQWIENPESVKDSAMLEQHAKQCEECRATIALLRKLAAARRAKQWTSPPDELTDRAIKSSQETPMTPSPDFDPTESGPPEVRGAEFGKEPGARFASRVFAEGEIGILVVPPEGNGRWKIRGRIWLHEAEGNAVAHLVHGEHVVASSTTDHSGQFLIEEIVAAGWALEVHLPSGRAIKIEESDL